MSGLINYSSRGRGQRSPTHSPDPEAATESVNPFSDSTATTQQYNNRAPAESSVAGETGYDGYTDSDTQPYGRDGGQGGRNIDTAQVNTTSQRSQGYRQREGGDDGDDGGAFFDPTFPSYEDEGPLEMAFFDHVVQDYGTMGIIGKTRLFVRQSLSFGLTLAALGIVGVLAFAHYFNPFKKSPPRAKPDREYERRITGERLSGRPEYYAEYWGYNCDTHDIVTQGGWILKAHRISDPRRPGPPGHPVILQHGILCNSSFFFTCEERSMAFWLVDQGYDVWVTNIRSNFNAGHTELKRSDPRFWAWGLKELAYDLRDVTEFICGATGKQRIAAIGHSQGSGSMLLGLSNGICPELGRRLTCFIALGPSVYAGPVLRQFPFSLMRQFRSRKWWSLVFGVKDFIPAIGILQAMAPAYLFGHLAYVIFSYLFKFHKSQWVSRQIPKLFRTLAVSTSSELLYWYMASFSHRGCIFDPRMTEPWFPRSCPPLTVIYGDIDYLVLGKPFVQRLERYERNVRVVHAVELQGYEHLDMIIGVDAHRTCFPVIKDTIEATLNPDERPQEMVQTEA
ncbi:unnamed protein product [Parajaminaea phylloscopi]